MKTRFFCALTCFLLTVQLSAQLQKGDISLEGNLGIGYQWSAGTGDGISIPVRPSAAWMVSDHWLLGAAFGANVYPGDDIDSDGFLGPFARYYFNPSSTTNNYFVGTSVNVLFLNNTELDATLSAGFNRFIGENLALETIMGYSLAQGRPNALSFGVGFRSFLSGDDWRTRKQAVNNLAQGGWLVGFSNASLFLTSDFINLGLSPNGGYFVTDRLVLGLDGGIGIGNSIGNDVRNITTTVVSLQPFVRYYFPNTGQRLIPFGQVGVGGTLSNIDQEDFFQQKSRQLSTHARLGANLFLAPNVAFEFSLDLRRAFNSDAEITYNRDAFPNEEIFPNIDGTIENRELELSLNMGVQIFLFRE